ncbi:MAG: type II toxin-antitoxin system RelE/ParE family toxin [Vicinamibacteria bacterium]
MVDLLEAEGTALGFPYSSGIRESRFPLRELRVQSRGRPIRVFYAFDPWRQAVLLIAGDKTGDDRFYETLRRENHLVSTLRRYVEALGGELEIVASFGDKRVRLQGI